LRLLTYEAGNETVSSGAADVTCKRKNIKFLVGGGTGGYDE